MYSSPSLQLDPEEKIYLKNQLLQIFYTAFYSHVLIMAIGILTFSWVLILYRKA
jgi:hypothetical protein